MSKATQTQKILAWLKEGHSITPLEALTRFGCMRLSGRIFDIRHMGYEIITEWETNGTARYARYWLKGETA